MQTNLAYIDEVMDREVERRSAANAIVPDGERERIRKAAVKPIAGFRVFDEATERKLLDERIAKQREAVESFISDRKKVRDNLLAAGILPLAVVPTAAWAKLCNGAELFRMKVDGSGQVGISRSAFDATPKKDKDLIYYAEHDWKGMLKAMFPGFVSDDGSSVKATLVLPQPPEDVVDVLLKASGASLSLKTAAVAEAISFRETVVELRNREIKQREEDERIAEMIRLDPIVYTEEGTATAVLAQFGDFPIEKELVDAVSKADDLIPDKPAAVDSLWFNDAMTLDQYARLMMTQRSLLQRPTSGLFGGWR